MSVSLPSEGIQVGAPMPHSDQPLHDLLAIKIEAEKSGVGKSVSGRSKTTRALLVAAGLITVAASWAGYDFSQTKKNHIEMNEDQGMNEHNARARIITARRALQEQIKGEEPTLIVGGLKGIRDSFDRHVKNNKSVQAFFDTPAGEASKAEANQFEQELAAAEQR